MKNLYLRVSLLAFALIIATKAEADLTHTCFFTDVYSGSGYGTADPSVPWFPSGAVVDVYYSTLNAGYDYRPWSATGLTEAQFAAATIKAVAIWNEQSGARLRLRYMGPYGGTAYPCNQSLSQQCAVVITGEPMDDMTACNAQVNTAGSLVVLDTAHRFQQGIIQFFRRNGVGGCHVLAWTADTSGYGFDVVRTLTHELGHSIFAMGHQTVASATSDCTKLTPQGNQILSVMNIPFTTGDGRSLKAWDKEVAQLRYGSRAPTAQLFKSIISSGTTWISGRVTGTTNIHPLYRPMSMAQGPSQQTFPWIEAQSVVNGFGAGAAYTAGYEHGLFNVNTIFLQLTGPTAIASTTQSSGATLMFAYKRPASTVDFYSTDLEQICWRISSNFGSSWGSETCASSVLSANHGITAAYNQSANVFVIPYVDATSSYGFFLKLLLVSPSGAVVGSSPVALNIKSGMQPAVACRQGTNTCLLVYAADDVNGSMSWVTLTINTTTLAVSLSSVISSITTIDTTPGLAYDVDNAVYRLARAEKSSAIFSYIRFSFLGSEYWAGNGDIYNNGGGATQISGAAFSTRYRSPLTTKLYGWFVKYF